MRNQAAKIFEDLFHVHPAVGRERAAARASLAVGGPLVALAASDRLEWGLFVVFGAMASAYGGTTPFAGRWRIQSSVAVLMVAASITGTAVGMSGERAWLVVAAAGLWGVWGAHLSDTQRWLPPGPLFLIFAVGACGSHLTTLTDLVASLFVGCVVAVWAVGLGFIEERWVRVPGTPDMGRFAGRLPFERRRMHLVRVAIVVLVAGGVATASGIGHPYWAMVAAVAPISVPRLRAQVARGVQRSVGTVIGVLIAAGILALEPSVWTIVVLAIVLQALIELTVTRNYALAMLFITPIALLMGQMANAAPVREILIDRTAETIWGVSVGLIAAWVTREGRWTGRRSKEAGEGGNGSGP